MKTLRDASVATKVALAPLIAIACLIAIAALGWGTARELTSALRTLHSTSLQSLITISELQRRLGSAFAHTNQSLAWTGAEFPPARIEALDKSLTQDLDAIERLLAQQAAAENWDAASGTQLRAVVSAYGPFKRAALDALDMKSSGLQTAAAFVQAVGDTYGKLDGQIQQLEENLRGSAARRVEASTVMAERRSLAVGVAALAALLVCAVAGWICTRLIVQPLKEAQRVAGAVAQGDLTPQDLALASDETGHVLSALVDVAGNLNRIVMDVRRSAEQVNQASEEIAAGNTDLSERTERTAAALEETAAAVEQLSATVQSSADRARDANRQAQDASSVAREGGNAVADVVRTMESVNAQAKEIGEIVGVIDGIAFQTNILALNAAVEAARAGEQGRGFSIVAGEVRTLAKRSADASREIRALINKSVEQIARGTGEAQVAGRTMGRVVGAIENVARTVEDIAHATAEQATGITQINQTVADMDRSTQQNAALVEQAGAATGALRQQATSLVQMLTRFRTA